MCKKPRDLKDQHEARHHIFSTGISLSETRSSCRPHVCYSGTSPSSQAFSLLTSLSRSWSAFGPLHHRLAHFVDEIYVWVGGSSLVCLVSGGRKFVKDFSQAVHLLNIEMTPCLGHLNYSCSIMLGSSLSYRGLRPCLGHPELLAYHAWGCGSSLSYPKLLILLGRPQHVDFELKGSRYGSCLRY
jgi:hypothetical protein